MQDGLETFGKKGDVSWRMLVNWMEHNGKNFTMQVSMSIVVNFIQIHRVPMKFF